MQHDRRAERPSLQVGGGRPCAHPRTRLQGRDHVRGTEGRGLRLAREATRRIARRTCKHEVGLARQTRG
jgi:hypothetical protein